MSTETPRSVALVHPADELGEVLAAALRDAGRPVFPCATAVDFARAFAGALAEPPGPGLAVVATDPGWAEAGAVVETLRERWPDLPVVLIGPADRPGVVRVAVRLGVLDLLPPTVAGVAALRALLVELAAPAVPDAGAAPPDLPDPHADGAAPDTPLRVAELAHDLHQPLRSVQRLGERLEAHLVQAGDAEGRAVVEAMRTATLRLQDMVDGMLVEHRRDGAGDAAPSSLPADAPTADADRVLDEVLAGLAAAVDDAGARVSRGPLPEVAVAPHLLRRILQNLVANAIQHGGTPPRVHVTAHRVDGGEWAICVRDNGPGLSPEPERRSALARALAAGGQQRRSRGHGLGLRIVQRLVDRAGGTLTLENVAGDPDGEPGGTLATVRLPADPALAEDAPTVVHRGGG